MGRSRYAARSPTASLARGGHSHGARQSERSPRPGRAGRCASSRTATPPGSAIERRSSDRSSRPRCGSACCAGSRPMWPSTAAAIVNEGGEVHQVTQPVEMPAGWGENRVLSEACMARASAVGCGQVPRPGRAEPASSIDQTEKPCRLDVVRFGVTQVAVEVRGPQCREAAALAIDPGAVDRTGGVRAAREDRSRRSWHVVQGP